MPWWITEITNCTTSEETYPIREIEKEKQNVLTAIIAFPSINTGSDFPVSFQHAICLCENRLNLKWLSKGKVNTKTTAEIMKELDGK